MMTRRVLLVLASVAVTAGGIRAEGTLLGETVSAKDCQRIVMTMKLDGEMVVVQNGKPASLKLAAIAEHRYRERIIGDKNQAGLPPKAIRFYDDARAAIQVDGVSSPRTLRPDRRLSVIQRDSGARTCWCPAGTLTREELELVSEHFDTLALPGLLPGAAVALNETWQIADPCVQALCNFDGLVSHELVGKYGETKDGLAIVSVTGSAKGIELGASSSVKIAATIRVDVARQQIVAVEWKQTDTRDQGPASPAVNAETTITIAREAGEPRSELADEIIAGLPASSASAPTDLTIRDVKNRFEIACSRDWQLTGRTDAHIVLRLLDRGEFIAQATVTPWQSATAGQHTDPRAFRDAMLRSPGWTAEQAIGEGEIPGRNGRRIFRLAARGHMDNIPVVQTFYLVAFPSGEQIVVAVTTKPTQVEKLAARDLSLLDGLSISGK